MLSSFKLIPKHYHHLWYCFSVYLDLLENEVFKRVKIHSIHFNPSFSLNGKGSACNAGDLGWEDPLEKVNCRLPSWLSWQRICLQCRRPGFDPCVGKIPWRKKWQPILVFQPTLVFLPGEFHRQRSQAGYSPWDCKQSDTTERLSRFSLFMLPRWR